jgi:hypothetical protein
MRLLANFAAGLLASSAVFAATFSYHIVGEDPGGWPKILEAVGVTRSATGVGSVFVVRGSSPLNAKQWYDRMDRGAILVLEGDTPLARDFGFVPTDKQVVVRGVQDLRAPDFEIVWERPLALPIYTMPAAAKTLVRERWDRAPLVAAMKRGKGGVLWLAVTPGKEGHERFPYLIQALAEVGSRRRSGHVICGPSSMARIAAGLIWTISRSGGGSPVSQRCTLRHGITTMATPNAMNICTV